MFRMVVSALNFADKVIREAGGVVASVERMVRKEAEFASRLEGMVREIVFLELNNLFREIRRAIEPKD